MPEPRSSCRRHVAYFIIALFTAAILLEACGGQSSSGQSAEDYEGQSSGKPLASAPASEYPFSLERPLAFSASSEGLLPFTQELSREGSHVLLTATEKGTPSILAVVGGYGIVLLEPSPSGSSFRLRAFPNRSFEGLDPGGAWPTVEGFLVQLFRNPLSQAETSPLGPRLFTFGKTGLQALSPAGLQSSVNQSEELFAFFPYPRRVGAWLAQLRSSEAGDSVTSSFRILNGLEGSSVPMERQAFETVLRPRPIADEGSEKSLGGFSKALGAEALRIGGSDFVLRIRSTDGGEGYWAKGAADQARILEAWSSKAGSFLLEASGHAIYRVEGQAAEREIRLVPPLIGAKFGSAVFLPLAEGAFVVAAWETEGGQSSNGGSDATSGFGSGLLAFRL